MYQIRLHGRGGQGVVTAAELIAWAAIADGHYALAFPSFGSERTGAPVEAYCRVDTQPIRAREPVTEPDLVVVLDPTLLRQRFVLAGLKPGGCALINSPLLETELAGALAPTGPSSTNVVGVPKGGSPAGPGPGSVRVLAVPATEFAKRRTGRPLPNAAMLGAIAAATGVVRLAAVRDAIAARFPAQVAETNTAAATDAFEHVQRGEPAPRREAAPAAAEVDHAKA